MPGAGIGKITAAHRRRDAVIYVRQSTLSQVQENTESLALQYELRRHAAGLGWDEQQITVIDEDLARSAATARGRLGFTDLVASVGLGKVGIIIGREVSRLARNNALFRYRNKAFCSAYGFMPRRAAPSLAGAASAAVGSA
jgi:DNA invertase Pin-like site-specific DNA recombinase